MGYRLTSLPVWVASAMAVTLGCGQHLPGGPLDGTGIPLAGNGHPGAVPPAQIVRGTRKVLFDGQAIGFDELRHSLPAEIRPCDAARLLVHILPGQAASAQYQTQATGWYGTGFYSPFVSSAYDYAYYPTSGYYFPYTLDNGLYYPYTYSRCGYGIPSILNNYGADYCNYQPFFYNYNNRYYPYTYWY